MERRLAAILAADVAGYSRLIGQDDAATIRALREHHADMLPLVAAAGGRVVDTAGDSILAEFASTVAAVECALAMQEAVAERNRDVPPERRLLFRIGIEQGEIAREDDRLYGDGLNAAARLQTLASPGGIAISSRVHEDLAGKLDASWTDGGEHRLKNIARPVRVFFSRAPRDGPPGEAAPEAGAGLPAASPAIPRIAVKPFASLGGGEEQALLGQGVTDDIVTELSRFRGLTVITYDAALEQTAPGAAAVDFLLSGSIRRGGGRIRIVAQLVERPGGRTVWSERYDHAEEDIFRTLDEAVHTVVATVTGRITYARTDAVRRKPPSSLAAYEWVLRGNALPFDDPAAADQARFCFEKAVELDPSYASAYALLGMAYCQVWFNDLDTPDSLLDEALAVARKGLSLDDHESLCHSSVGYTHLLRRSFDLAEHHQLRAYELNPNRPAILVGLGDLYTSLGDPARSLDCFRRARQLDPYFEPSFYWTLLGVAHFFLGQHEEAIAALLKAPGSPYWTQAYLVAATALAGREEEARAAAERLRRTCPRFDARRFVAREPHRRPEFSQTLLAALAKAGLS